ncbi:class I SAM-dependent methyltransferase [Anaerovorax sp. IOR16]|uniref:class I SAM-dependent methyltransferase n=1 Tax=Anaerovorax sp. IOR16 TaxID=2773458 RepID=UPI0019D04CE6|nr:class I SAM-dependent methyltransferase [Anaerovorax sp. IOR16]
MAGYLVEFQFRDTETKLNAVDKEVNEVELRSKKSVTIGKWLDNMNSKCLHWKTPESASVEVLYGLCQYLSGGEKKTKNVAEVPYETFAAILRFVCAKICNYSVKEQDTDNAWFYSKWLEYYGHLSHFEMKQGTSINEVNLSESGDYLDAFEMIEEGGAVSIENATRTLLENIPQDVERILDLGSGPGYVNQKIPACYHVLAMDIDMDILKQNKRPFCLGDALDIPLKSGAVDLVITCDMLEHIEETKLSKAISEITRVSKKYAYIQVPYDENLRAGMAYCLDCGNVWHVNHHKNCFDAEDLVKLMAKDWIPLRVNYTGEVTYLNRLHREYEFFEWARLPCNLISGWKCPKCGAESAERNREFLEQMRFTLDCSREELPQYSEVGILFIKKDRSNEFPVAKVLERKKIKLKDNEIDFMYENPVCNTYSIQECRPFIFIENDQYNWMQDEGVFQKDSTKEWGWVGILYPFLFQQDDVLCINGSVKWDMELKITTTTNQGNETGLYETKVSQGRLTESIPIPPTFYGNRAILKIYFNSPEIALSYVKIDRKEPHCYDRFFLKKDESSLAFQRNGLVCTYYTGAVDYLDVSKPSKRREAIDGSWLMEYIQLHKKTIDSLQKGMNSAEYVNTVNQMQQCLKREKAKMDFCMSTLQEKVIELDYKILCQQASNELMISQLCVEQVPKNKESPPQKTKQKLFRGMALTIRNSPFLYGLCIQLGIKRLYNKCKRRNME